MYLKNMTVNNTGMPEVKTCFQIATDTAFTTDDNPTPYIVNAVLNSVLSALTTTANVLVFLAVFKTNAIHLPSRLLLFGLVLTDLAVGSLAQPLFVMFLITKASGRSDSAPLCFMVSSTTLVGAFMGCVSLMNMTAISLDRYVAVHHHLKYHEIVTSRRVCAVLAVIWACATGFVCCWLLDKVIYISLGVAILSSCSLITIVAYTKIYRQLRCQNDRQTQERGQIDVVQYRRSASSMLWVYCILTFCYMPYVCVEVTRRFVGDPVLMECILEFSVTVVYLNSCLNPFIYCLHLPEIRAGVVQILRKVRCWSTVY